MLAKHQLMAFNESSDDSWNSFPTAFTHCAQEFIIFPVKLSVRLLLIKCISFRTDEGFWSVHVWLRMMENEGKVDEDLFIVKGLHSLVTFQSYIMKIYFSTIISITSRAWNKWTKSRNFQSIFASKRIVEHSGIGTNVFGCRDEANQITSLFHHCAK